MPTQDDDDRAVRTKIAQLPAFNDVATRLHEIVMQVAPDLKPRLWYGMPGYAPAKSKPVIVFFRVDADDYVTFGLTEKADLPLDDADPVRLIPSAWFLTELNDATEARIAQIVRSAAGGGRGSSERDPRDGFRQEHPLT